MKIMYLNISGFIRIIELGGCNKKYLVLLENSFTKNILLNKSIAGLLLLIKCILNCSNARLFVVGKETAHGVCHSWCPHQPATI